MVDLATINQPKCWMRVSQQDKNFANTFTTSMWSKLTCKPWASCFFYLCQNLKFAFHSIYAFPWGMKGKVFLKNSRMQDASLKIWHKLDNILWSWVKSESPWKGDNDYKKDQNEGKWWKRRRKKIKTTLTNVRGRHSHWVFCHLWQISIIPYFPLFKHSGSWKWKQKRIVNAVKCRSLLMGQFRDCS